MTKSRSMMSFIPSESIRTRHDQKARRACLAESLDLQLLLRLIQAGRGYLKDGDRALEPRELLRLAVLGGKVQVPACVAQCAAALGADMTSEDAAELLTCMPGEMDGLEEIRALRHKALDVLVTATETDTEAELGAKVCACLTAMIEGASQEGGAGEVEARVWRVVGNLADKGAVEEQLDAAAGAGRRGLPGARPQAVAAPQRLGLWLVGGAVGQGRGERRPPACLPPSLSPDNL
jgi:hypothetical protein